MLDEIGKGQTELRQTGKDKAWALASCSGRRKKNES
jgi:hypothetical protein